MIQKEMITKGSGLEAGVGVTLLEKDVTVGVTVGVGFKFFYA